LTRQEVIGRYKGSFLGLGWSFLNPILMLVIYTFVFSVVFQARWGDIESDSKTLFAMVLFTGLICHSMFTEVAIRAPGLVQGNANYVKKVVFPLEILPVVAIGSSLFHSIVSIAILLLALIVTGENVHFSSLLLPIVLLPLILLILGLAWFLASIGVYLRDVGPTVTILTTVLLFLSPIFYPLSSLPENYQIYLLLNPLTFIIEQARAVLIFGNFPDWSGLAIYFTISCGIAWGGYWWFQKTRRGFADVL
jgi:lipopolysaccharide transport system permease protein